MCRYVCVCVSAGSPQVKARLLSVVVLPRRPFSLVYFVASFVRMSCRSRVVNSVAVSQTAALQQQRQWRQQQQVQQREAATPPVRVGEREEWQANMSSSCPASISLQLTHTQCARCPFTPIYGPSRMHTFVFGFHFQ